MKKENNRYLYKSFLTSRRKGRNDFCISVYRMIIYGNLSVGVCFFLKNFCLTLCGWSISARNGTISLFLGIWSSPPITQQRKKRRMIDSLQVMTVYRHFSCSLAYDTYAFHFYYHLTNCDCRLTQRPFFFDYTYTNKHTHSIIDVKILSHKQKSNVYRIIPWHDFVDGI